MPRAPSGAAPSVVRNGVPIYPCWGTRRRTAFCAAIEQHRASYSRTHHPLDTRCRESRNCEVPGSTWVPCVWGDPSSTRMTALNQPTQPQRPTDSGLTNVGQKLVVVTLRALPKDQLRLSGWLVIDRREASRGQADDDIMAAHFYVEAIARVSVHAGHRGTRLRGTSVLPGSREGEPRPQGAGARLTLGILGTGELGRDASTDYAKPMTLQGPLGASARRMNGHWDFQGAAGDCGDGDASRHTADGPGRRPRTRPARPIVA